MLMSWPPQAPVVRRPTAALRRAGRRLFARRLWMGVSSAHARPAPQPWQRWAGRRVARDGCPGGGPVGDSPVGDSPVGDSPVGGGLVRGCLVRGGALEAAVGGVQPP